MEIGLFFGSFNPVHSGHLMLAQYMVNFAHVDEVWFVVSPQNPFKVDKQMATAADRVEMVRRSIDGNSRMKVCDIELRLPIPSFTINTLEALKKEYPGNSWTIIMGGDNVEGLPRWHRAEDVLKYRIVVYPRPGHEIIDIDGSRIEYTEAPMIDVSSTMLREWIRKGLDVAYYIPREAVEYINDKKLY